jgi:hypothetical protein
MYEHTARVHLLDMHPDRLSKSDYIQATTRTANILPRDMVPRTKGDYLEVQYPHSTPGFGKILPPDVESSIPTVQ